MYRASDPTFNIDYVRSRLEGTTLYHPKGRRLVLVRRVALSSKGGAVVDVTTDWGTRSTFLGGVVDPAPPTLAKVEVERLLLEDLELKSPTLGNVNYDNTCSFVARAPVRNDWKQGLRWENIRYTGKRPPLQFLIQPIENVYPKFINALDMVEDYYNEVAISRHFSIKDNYTLEYKKKFLVGHLNPDNGSLKVHEQATWLTELAQEEAGVVLSNQQH